MDTCIVYNLHACWVSIKCNSPNDLFSLPITDIDKLQSFDKSKIQVRWRLIVLRSREELSLAWRMLLAFIKLFQPWSFIFWNFFEVIWVLENVEVVNNIILLVTHFENIEVSWSLRIVFMPDDFHQVWILSALPHANRSIGKWDQNTANRI